VSSHPYSVRRATIDDLAVLRALWTTARLPVFELEPRLTEFQLAARDDGAVGGAVGLRVEGWHCWLHSPCFYSAAEEKSSLPALWQHVQQVSRGKGVARFWIAGPPGEFWQTVGFRPATAADLNRLPAAFRLPAGKKEWWTFSVRNDALLEKTIEREFARLQAENRADTDRLRRHAKFWTGLGFLLAAALAMSVIWMLFMMFNAMGKR
jgi:N-acetylglutamate synthase-like GNAT family acetyltransferase